MMDKLKDNGRRNNAQMLFLWKDYVDMDLIRKLISFNLPIILNNKTKLYTLLMVYPIPILIYKIL